MSNSIAFLFLPTLLAGLGVVAAPQTRAQGSTNMLGASALVEGPAAGSNSVPLAVSPSGAAWTATANTAWLHLATASGQGGTNVAFGYDANSGGTRTGTLTIGGQVLTVTQVGASYVAANLPVPLVSTGLSSPSGVAVDGAGNVYIADTGNSAIKRWNVLDNTTSTLVASGLNGPTGLAMDAGGNLFIADSGNGAIKKWDPSGVTTLVESGLNGALGVAVDAAGNVYIADTANNAIKRWKVADGTVESLFTAVRPAGVAVDALGNVYATSTGGGNIVKRDGVSGAVSTVAGGMEAPYGLAVDGLGNLQFSDTNSSQARLWCAVSNQVFTLWWMNLIGPRGVAVDSARNVYIADAGANVISERPRAFVDITPVTAEWDARGGTLSPVWPTTQNLAGPFAPASDQWWLTITGVTNGVVSFSLATNTQFATRSAHISLLGQTITVTQQSLRSLSATTLDEDPQTGIDQVSLRTGSPTYAWTATANAAWLHILTPSGTGSGTVSFTFEENAGPERNCLLTIAGLTLRVRQHAANWSGTPVATQAATGVSGSGATLHGSVNANAAGTGSYFEYATNGGWLVSTLAAAGLDYCSSREDLAADSEGCFYVCKPDCNELDIICPTNGTYFHKVMPHPYLWHGCSSMIIDGDVGYVAADWCIYRCDLTLARNLAYSTNSAAPDGLWVAWAGDCSVTQQSVDGQGAAARFRSILGMVRNALGEFYVGCMYNLREVTQSNVMVTTLTDQGSNAGSNRDGPCKSSDPSQVALINGATGIAADDFNNLYFTARGMPNDFYIRKIPLTGPCRVTSVAGAGTAGCDDGTGREATFTWPCNLVVDKGGNVYVDDQRALRKMTPDGIVTTLALRDADTGADLTYRLWLGLTKDRDGNFMVVNSSSGSIQRIAYGLAAPVAAAPAQNNLPQTGSATDIAQTIAGLLPGTTYFYRAVVTNSLGTNYGEILSFTTPSVVLQTTNFVEGPAAGTDSVVLGADPTMNWTATANVAWLRATPGSGAGSANIHFSFDANSGATRTGILTVAHQTVSVLQAGSTYSRADFLGTLPAAGLSAPNGLAVDGAGNIYVADTAQNAIRKWTVSDGSVSDVVTSGLNAPRGVAVDRLGNVYIADTGNNAVKKWSVAGGQLTTLRFPDGLSAPQGVAVDGRGNVYVADTGHGTIQQWIPGNAQVIPLVTSGLSAPAGVAVDAGGNVCIADTGHGSVKWWSAFNSNVTDLVTSGLSVPAGVAVDGGGNVYIADTGNGAIKRWSVLDGSVSPLVSSGLSAPAGVTVDGWGNVYFADTGNQALKEIPRAFVDTATRTSSPLAASSTVLEVAPTAQNLAGPFFPASDQSWLTVDWATNGLVSYSYADNFGSARTGTINLLGRSFAVQQAGFVSQLTTNVVEGPAAATNSVALAVAPSTAWTASANADWLHVRVAAGTGATNVSFACDANRGQTRTGTLTIAGQTVTVTQAGSTYSPASLTDLATAGLSNMLGVAVDQSGNVYIADTGNNAIKKLTVADGTVSTLVSTGLSSPAGVAADAAGNVYIADTGNNAIKKWNVADSTVSTLVSNGLSGPQGVAVDRWGNVYIGDCGNGAVKRWNIGTGAVTVLVAGLNNPRSVSVDALGNVYFPGVYIVPQVNQALMKWTETTRTVTTLARTSAATGYELRAVAEVDGSGDICSLEWRVSQVSHTNDYGHDFVTNTFIWKWNPAVETLSPGLGIWLLTNGLSVTGDLAADTGGNLYFADMGNGTVKELPRAFVDATARVLPPTAGVSKLPAVVSATPILTGALAPTSDQPWLTITDVSGGVVTYSVTACPVAARTGHIFLLGRSIAVTQTSGSLSAANLTEGPGAGTDTVVVGANGGTTWTATANASWLHVPAGDRVGATNLLFTFDANAGATRSGTLTLNGQILTVLQAGATYSAANPLATLASAGLSAPAGVAVDAAGNVYIADRTNNAILKWKVADGSLSALVSSGLNHPAAVAVDGYSNLYIADTGNNSVKRCGTAGGAVTTLVSTGLNAPSGVAVDGWGNVYIADQGNHAVKRWNEFTGTVSPLVTSGLSAPSGLALDAAGNLYIADSGNGTVQEWVAASGAVSPLISGLSHPGGIAVDSSGNVLIADTANQVIKKWSAMNGALTTVVDSGLSGPEGVAVDTWGNLYVADTGHGAVREVPRAFADYTAKTEPANAGTDTLPALVPSVQNLSGPLVPTSDAAWLTVAGVTNGVVSFGFSQNNTGANRTGHVTLLGRTIAVSQGFATLLGTVNMVEGPAAGRDSTILAATSPSVTWTVTPNADWLHTVTASGKGSSNVIFTFDANTGSTRSGSLQVGDQLVTVVQGGSTYVAANPVTTLAAGLSGPRGVALDSVGNVYFADSSSGNTNAIKKWSVTNNTVTTLVAEGTSQPWGVAVDAAGNVYYSEANSIKRWNATNSGVTTLVSSGLSSPQGLAIDRWGCVYIVDSGNRAVKKLNPANNTVTPVCSGLTSPFAVAVDVIGNLYVADGLAVKKWNPASSNLTTLVSVANLAYGVAVDGSGNLYIAENNPNNLVTNLGSYYVNLGFIEKWSASDGTLTRLAASDLNTVYGVAVDGSGNLYVANTGQTGANSLQEMPRAFVDAAPKIEPVSGGTDSLSVVLPETQNLSGPFTPASDQPWLTLSAAVNGVVGFDFSLSSEARTRTGHINLLGRSIPVYQGSSATYAVGLGMTNRVEGPAAGTDSVVLAVPAGTAWSATADSAWLHLPADSGAGSGTVRFSFDANPGLTRTGALAIAGQTLTVIQAGATYAAANLRTNLVSTQLNGPDGVAVDGSGNVYFADTTNNVLKRWSVADGSVSPLIASGLVAPGGVAADALGNVYVSVAGSQFLKRWNALDGSVADVAVGLAPRAVAVDAYNNLFTADASSNLIYKRDADDGVTRVLLVPDLLVPAGVAADLAGNVYITDPGNGTVKRWDAGSQAVTQVCSSLAQPGGVAVDGAGNVYISDKGLRAIWQLSAADSGLRSLVNGLAAPGGVAVDAAGNVYVADSGANSVLEMPRAFVDVAAKNEPVFAGTDTLPVVLPATQNLSGPFAPVSDQPWLTILGATNGVVSFRFAANPGSGRTAHISLLGRSIAVNQGAATLGIGGLVVGPAAGADSVALAAAPAAAWTATANAGWLHVTTAGGTGDTNVVFTFDANSGPTRTGTLSIADQTLTVTQAGAGYSLVNAPIPLGLSSRYPFGLDTAGNIYLPGSISVITRWNATNNTVTVACPDPTVVAERRMPSGIVVDDSGNIFFKDTVGGGGASAMFRRWDAASGQISNLGVYMSGVLAAAPSGDVYISGGSTIAIQKWDCVSGVISIVATNLNGFSGIGVDVAGNVYAADATADAIQKWNAARGAFTTLIPSVLGAVQSVGVDGSGNVWLISTNAVKKWRAADQTLTTVLSANLSPYSCLAVDAAGNAYFTDRYLNIDALPHAFVDTTVKTESYTAGSDSLSVVLPATQNLSGPFAPTNDQPWLTITGVTNGVVSFSFGSNTGAVRTAHIGLLGTNVTIIQGSNRPPVASPMTVAAPAGGSVKIALSALATRFSDPDGDPVKLVGLSATSTNNRSLTRLNMTQNADGSFVITNTAFIVYTNVTGPDAFGYTIADPLGATAVGTVTVAVATGPLGGQSTGIIYPRGGPVRVSFEGIYGFTYQVQRTTNLANPASWTTVSITNAPENGRFQFYDDFGQANPPPAAYYRLSWTP